MSLRIRSVLHAARQLLGSAGKRSGFAFGSDTSGRTWDRAIRRLQGFRLVGVWLIRVCSGRDCRVWSELGVGGQRAISEPLWDSTLSTPVPSLNCRCEVNLYDNGLKRQRRSVSAGECCPELEDQQFERICMCPFHRTFPPLQNPTTQPNRKPRSRRQ